LLTFFAAAKKVSPAPDRGRANKPLRIQVPWKPKRIKRLKPDPNPDPKRQRSSIPPRTGAEQIDHEENKFHRSLSASNG
jgi:hypothetical protein